MAHMPKSRLNDCTLMQRDLACAIVIGIYSPAHAKRCRICLRKLLHTWHESPTEYQRARANKTVCSAFLRPIWPSSLGNPIVGPNISFNMTLQLGSSPTVAGAPHFSSITAGSDGAADSNSHKQIAT